VRLSSTAPGFDAVAAAQALRATGRFRAVCPNYRLQPFATFPNDYYLPDQWYVHDPAGGDVHLPEAWDFEKGGSTVTIGIMDTGVDIGHPDLATRIWTNPGEVPGNGVDDDGNGYIDDVNGWDFGNDDADPDPEPIIDEIGLDIGFHGTFVAGIAAAAAGNAQGIAGASWNCLIVPLKVANAAGDITVEAVTPAFLYAADQHLSVLNMSLGSAPVRAFPSYFQALVDVADSAGVLCVAAAGNDGVDTPTYPAGCDRVLAVGAMDMGNVRAEFSNFGSWVDVAAPGASMWSTICRNYVIDDTSQLFYYVFFGWDGENPYMYGDGPRSRVRWSRACAPWCGITARAHPRAGGDAHRRDRRGDRVRPADRPQAERVPRRERVAARGRRRAAGDTALRSRRAQSLPHLDRALVHDHDARPGAPQALRPRRPAGARAGERVHARGPARAHVERRVGLGRAARGRRVPRRARERRPARAPEAGDAAVDATGLAALAAARASICPSRCRARATSCRPSPSCRSSPPSPARR
jgi:hypothetical protein